MCMLVGNTVTYEKIAVLLTIRALTVSVLIAISCCCCVIIVTVVCFTANSTARAQKRCPFDHQLRYHHVSTLPLADCILPSHMSHKNNNYINNRLQQGGTVTH
jgi:hypothetical protein